MPLEPDLSTTVDLASDRLSIRNIIYTAWSVFNSSASFSASGYKKWQVHKLADGKGYTIEFHFARKGFRVALSDMQMLQDACPLRIDSILVQDDSTNQEDINLCVCLLNSEQPVQLTETDVVRIRKRSRGLLGAASDWLASAAAAASAAKKK